MHKTYECKVTPGDTLTIESSEAIVDGFWIQMKFAAHPNDNQSTIFISQADAADLRDWLAIRLGTTPG